MSIVSRDIVVIYNLNYAIAEWYRILFDQRRQLLEKAVIKKLGKTIDERTSEWTMEKKQLLDEFTTSSNQEIRRLCGLLSTLK